MPEASHAREWDELRKIDYFLEHIARAVERGEVHRASYDLLAPRYLERRAELSAIIAPRVGDVGSVPRHAVEPAPGLAAAAVTAAAPITATALPSAMQPRLAPVPVRRERKPVPWTTVLTITGAFLVIVAAAIFAVATWDIFGVEFKLVFLGTLTTGFYGAGYLVRKRLRLDAGGVALMAVGSAMLLFDGWIAIDGYALEGPWPWVLWLAVCWVVYWYSETAIGGSFFGVIGAAAQVAWVWLLGEGLAWPIPQRMAGIAVVAVLWAIAARRASGRKPFVTLAAVLRWAAPVLAAGSAWALLQNIAIGPADWAYVLSALMVGLAATAVLDLADLPRGVAAVAYVPLLAGTASMVAKADAQWGHVALLACVAVGALLYELYRRGWGHGALAILSESAATLVLADLLGWEPDATLILVALVATSWLLSSRMLEELPAKETWTHGASSMRLMTEVAGWGVLALATLALPAASGVVPLTGVAVTGRDALLVAGVLVVWVAAVSVRRRPAVGLVVLGMSLYGAAAAMAWAFPELHSALYALGLVAVLALWFLVRSVVDRAWSLSRELTLVAVRILSVLILVVGLIAQADFFDVIAWQSGVLIVSVALLWLVDALYAEESQFGLAFASAFLVLAAVVVADWMLPGSDSVSWAGPLAALACFAIAIPLRARAPWPGFWCWGAGAAALMATMAAPGPSTGTLATALALTAAVWLGAAVLGRVSMLAVPALLLCYFALFAFADHLDLSSWSTLTLVAVPSYALLSTLFMPESLLPRRWADSLTAAGFLGMILLFIVYASGAASDPLAVEWGLEVSGGHELALALGLLGVFVIVAGIGRSIALAPYLGVALILLAYMVEIDTLDVGTVEWITTPLALYVIWAGSRARRGVKGRGTPIPDVLAAVIGLGVPALLASSPLYQNEPWVHLVWAVGLSLVAIVAGVALKVRGYFFGGVAALVFTAIVRSWFFLVAFWWLVLGVIGVTMLVIALTWERQQQMVASAQAKVHEALADWR